MREFSSKITGCPPKYAQKNKDVVDQNNGFSIKICGGVFEQLARYTMRYKESDSHLSLYSSLSSASNLNLPTLLTLFYFSALLYLLVQV